MGLAEEAEPGLTGPEQGTWLARLEAEHDNLQAALRWAAGSDQELSDPPARGGAQERGDLLLALRLAGALWRFWDVRGYLSEGRRWLERLLARVGPAQPGGAARAKALTGAARLAYRQGEYARATALHEESLAVSRELGDTRGVALSLHHLGLVAYRQGAAARAVALAEEGLALYRALGDQRGIAYSLDLLGNVACWQGDYARARALHAESLAMSRELGDTRGIARALHHLGEAACRQGAYVRAAALCEQSVAVYRELGDMWGIAYTLALLGDVACRQSDYARARALHAESLAMSRALGDRRGVVHSLEGLARVASAQGGRTAAPERAARLFRAAQALRATLGEPLPPTERADYERTVVAVRTALGDAAFTAAWTAGATLSLEQAMAEALQDGVGG
jgi:tetratricopeptide (TPR) repeat protein